MASNDDWWICGSFGVVSIAGKNVSLEQWINIVLKQNKCVNNALFKQMINNMSPSSG